MKTIKLSRGIAVRHYRPCQTNNGTNFFVKLSGDDSSIIVPIKGNRKIEAVKSWSGFIRSFACYGDTLFFLTGTRERPYDKIYKATFLSNKITIHCVRDVEQGEKHECAMLFSRVVNERKVVYRVVDSPENGIEVDVNQEALRASKLLAVHRKKLIYVRLATEVSVQAISPNIIELSSPITFPILSHGLSCYANGKSSIIYFLTDSNRLSALNTLTMDIENFNLRCDGEKPEVCALIGVRGSKIRLLGNSYSKPNRMLPYLYNADLRSASGDDPTQTIDKGMARNSAVPTSGHIIRYENTLAREKKDNAIMTPSRNDFIIVNYGTTAGSIVRSRTSEEFTAIDQIGRGAYGSVFRAKNILDGKSYAVKQIRLPDRTSEEADREIDHMVMEAKTMAEIDDHPNIVRYYASWIEEPISPGQKSFHDKDNCAFLYIQMQLYTHSLEDWLRSNWDMPRDRQRMRRMFKQMVEGVAYLHACGFIHRDLKPDNIFFDKDDHIRIGDLGIACAMHNIDGLEVSKTRTAACTPLYAAPEQTLKRYTSKVDMFALGLIYLEMLFPLNREEREKCFDKYRLGDDNKSIVIEDEETQCLIEGLANFESEYRWTAQEVLDFMESKE